MYGLVVCTGNVVYTVSVTRGVALLDAPRRTSYEPPRKLQVMSYDFTTEPEATLEKDLPLHPEPDWQTIYEAWLSYPEPDSKSTLENASREKEV